MNDERERAEFRKAVEFIAQTAFAAPAMNEGELGAAMARIARQCDGMLTALAATPTSAQPGPEGEASYMTRGQIANLIDAVVRAERAFVGPGQRPLPRDYLAADRGTKNGQGPAIPTPAQPVAWSPLIYWRPRQTEQVVKITRTPQPEHGFTEPLYTAAPPQTAQAPAQPTGYTDFQQRRGVAFDIIDEALQAYGQFLLDDDFQWRPAMDAIFDKMRERAALYAAAPPQAREENDS